jgi:ABC-2 type transport system permease protein
MKVSNIFRKSNRVLLRELVSTDFKLRYQDSVLGYMWSVLKPIMLFAILYIVFAKFMHFGVGVPHYAIYLLTGTVLWTFFQEATGQGLQAIVARGDLIRKINFPKYIIVLSSTISALINLAINIAVVLVFAIVSGVQFRLTILLVPLYIIELYIFSLGTAFFLGSLYVKFRDVAYIWEVFMQALFYAVPIIYPISVVATSYPVVAKIILLNPIAQAIQDIRYDLITSQTMTVFNSMNGIFMKLIPFVIVLVVFVGGSAYFKKHSKQFAEII